MKRKNPRYPLVKLSSNVQIVLSLIKEELKSRKLFEVLYEVGMGDCYFQPHLDHLILLHIGMDDGTDETFARYSDIMDNRCQKITADMPSIEKQALKAYTELMAEKKIRSTQIE